MADAAQRLVSEKGFFFWFNKISFDIGFRLWIWKAL